MGDLLTITEVARRSGVASSALRFYEARGLIASERSGSGHRRYPRAVLRRIAFIVFAQKIGLSLEEIGVELVEAAPQPRAGTVGLGEAVGQLDQARRRPHRRAGASEGRSHAMHRLRMPFIAAMPAGQSRGQRGALGSGAAVLDWQESRPAFQIGGEQHHQQHSILKMAPDQFRGGFRQTFAKAVVLARLR